MTRTAGELQFPGHGNWLSRRRLSGLKTLRTQTGKQTGATATILYQNRKMLSIDGGNMEKIRPSGGGGRGRGETVAHCYGSQYNLFSLTPLWGVLLSLLSNPKSPPR